MTDRQLPNLRMTIQALRRTPPSTLPKQPALAAAECGPRLDLDRPRDQVNYQSAT
jgi:hypothetical protein